MEDYIFPMNVNRSKDQSDRVFQIYTYIYITSVMQFLCDGTLAVNVRDTLDPGKVFSLPPNDIVVQA